MSDVRINEFNVESISKYEDGSDGLYRLQYTTYFPRILRREGTNHTFDVFYSPMGYVGEKHGPIIYCTDAENKIKTGDYIRITSYGKTNGHPAEFLEEKNKIEKLTVDGWSLVFEG